MYVTLILNDGREIKSKKIEMARNTILVKDVLQSFGIEKLKLEEKIWIKRLNFDEFRKNEYKMDSMLEWDKFNSCEIAISRTRPEKPSQNITNVAPDQFKQSSDSDVSGNRAKKRAMEEMLIMDLVIKNQERKK